MLAVASSSCRMATQCLSHTPQLSPFFHSAAYAAAVATFSPLLIYALPLLRVTRYAIYAGLIAFTLMLLRYAADAMLTILMRHMLMLRYASDTI